MKQKSAQAIKMHKSLSEESKKKLIGYILSVLVGALFSAIRFSDRLSPFGASVVSALDGGYGFFALVGSILGYAVIGALGEGVRYISQMLIILSVKWAFATFFKTEQKWALPVLSAAVNLAVGSVMLFAETIIIYDILYLLAESVICAGATYFIAQVFVIFKKGASFQKSENVVAFSICVALCLISLSRIEIGFISVGNVIAALVVMSMSHALGALGGAAAGLTVGAAISL
ncbi:MAG: hypothetical protein IJ370_07250, partial [Oscillospiraceae bacterium]|nr:hypothetical protein [Oscillospiraceae bacterium]